MSRTPDQPRLTPQFCFNQTALRGEAPSLLPQLSSPEAHAHTKSGHIDFLRISRGAVDDTITQNLNTLATPSREPFDPTSTAQLYQRPLGRRPLALAACQKFKNEVLFPSWQSRSDVLNYCAGVATSPDPDDPNHVLRENEDARARERIIDERLDPYSARYFPRDTRTEALAALIRDERMVENIIRARTWALVGERCENEGDAAEKALDEWRSK